MRVTVRKAPPPKDAPEGSPPPVVIEVWASSPECITLDFTSVPLREAIEECLVEHLRTRYRVSRQVKETQQP